ncbi:hypothetical protein V1477_010325 [Vespula maculifrons]|uniref:Uncharacterized protein n=1 Tax=Vespula maculifrons TaxID=7453 RepID=A0ABD2C887_VESMC
MVHLQVEWTRLTFNQHHRNVLAKSSTGVYTHTLHQSVNVRRQNGLECLFERKKARFEQLLYTELKK